MSPEIRENVKKAIAAPSAAPREIAIVPNGVDLAVWRPRTEGRRPRAARRAARPPVVGFLGSFYQWQGLDRLLAAAPLVLAREPRTLFLLAGFGPEEERLKELARPLGDAVRFVGRVPLEDGPAWVNAFDVGVHLVMPGKACSPVKLLCYMGCARRSWRPSASTASSPSRPTKRVAALITRPSARSRTECSPSSSARAPRTVAGRRVPAAARYGWDGVAVVTEEFLRRSRRCIPPLLRLGLEPVLEALLVLLVERVARRIAELGSSP